MPEKVFRGDRLKQAREQHGWSQQDLGERFGSSKMNIYRYEAGIIEPTPLQITRLALELDVTTDWLLGLVDDPHGYRQPTQPITPDEQRFLDSLRSGNFRKLLGLIQQAIPDEEQQSDISDLDVGIDRQSLDSRE